MKITNDTTTYQIAELIGPEADEMDGRIMGGILARECVVDTEEVSEAQWLKWVEEAAEKRRAIEIGEENERNL